MPKRDGGIWETRQNVVGFVIYVAFCDIDISPGACYSQIGHNRETRLADSGGMKNDQRFEFFGVESA